MNRRSPKVHISADSSDKPGRRCARISGAATKERQVQRLKRRFRTDSVAWLQHGNVSSDTLAESAARITSQVLQSIFPEETLLPFIPRTIGTDLNSFLARA